MSRRRVQQPGDVQPHVPPDRWRVAGRVSGCARSDRGSAQLLCHGLDQAEQFWIRLETELRLAWFSTQRQVEVQTMFKSLAISSIYVLDQDKALDFYVGKLGLEVNTDQDLGMMRWLTVNVPGDSRQILLEKPGPPGLDV